MVCNLGAVCLGFLLDLLVGDPERLPHMVRLMGGGIRLAERLLRPLCKESAAALTAGGALLAACVPLGCLALAAGGLFFAYSAGFWPGFLLASLLAHQVIAARDLSRSGRAVLARLEAGDLAGAREALSRIVGRDTAALDEAGVVRAAVETLAENLSDGVVAPLFYALFFGIPAAVFYKAASTLDSMVGYKNARYLFFGRASARLDDVLSFVPARLTAWLIVLTAPLCGLDGGGARRILARDGGNHPSPNAGRPEAAAAGALGIRLGGGGFYGGVWSEKPTLGDADSPPAPEHIRLADDLVRMCSLAAVSAGSLTVFFITEGAKHL